MQLLDLVQQFVNPRGPLLVVIGSMALELAHSRRHLSRGLVSNPSQLLFVDENVWVQILQLYRAVHCSLVGPTSVFAPVQNWLQLMFAPSLRVGHACLGRGLLKVELLVLAGGINIPGKTF